MKECMELLKSGVFNEIIVDTNRSVSENLFEWLKSTTYEQVKKKRNAGLGIGLPIGEAPIDLSASFSEDEFNQFRQEVQQGRHRQFTESEAMQIVQRTVDPVIVEQYVECLGLRGYGLRAEIDAGKEYITLMVRWAPRSMEDLPPTVVSFDAPGTKFKPDVFPKGMEIPVAGYTAILQRVGRGEIKVVLNTTKGTFDETIDAPGPKLPRFRFKVFEARSEEAQIPEVMLSIPPSYKIISGGARANWGYDTRPEHPPGVLLTASYPEDLQTWIAKAKAHSVPQSCTLTAWAIAIHDPNDAWDVQIWSRTSNPEPHPRIAVTVNGGYTLTGGGAQTHWAGAGNLLTASFPKDSDTWEARGKDHTVPSPAAITSYAIGIKARNNAAFPATIIETEDSPVQSLPDARAQLDSDYQLLGGGALVEWSGAGNLLTASYPDGDRSWRARSKDHEHPSPARIIAYAIGVKKEELT